MNLYQINQLMNELERKFEENEIDNVENDETMIELVAELSEDFNEQFENMIERIKHLESERDYLKKRSDEISKMAKTTDNKIKRYKDFLMFLLENRQMKKFNGKCNNCTIVENVNGALIVEDEKEIPKGFYEAQKPKLNNSALKRFIMNGNIISSVRIETSKYLKF